MMFTKKALLGSLSFSTILMVGNLSGAIAQNTQSSNVHPFFRPFISEIKPKLPSNLYIKIPRQEFENIRFFLALSEMTSVVSRDGKGLRVAFCGNNSVLKRESGDFCLSVGYLGSIHVFPSTDRDSLKIYTERDTGVWQNKKFAKGVTARCWGLFQARTKSLPYCVWQENKQIFVVTSYDGLVDAVINGVVVQNDKNDNASLSSASNTNTNNQNCITWDTYTSDLPPQGGRGGQWKAFKKLPPAFQNGCVLLENNNSLDTAYVLTVGLSPDSYKGRPLGFQNVPAFNRNLTNELDKLVRQGKALKVTWLTPTNGAIPYLRSIPHDRAFLRKDGMTCFSTVCMVSGDLSHRELSDILTISGQSK